MVELVEYIAKNLVDKPDEVKLNTREGDHATIIELTVASEDMGKVIGKQGRIAKAIRTVVKAASIKENKKYIVEILDETERSGDEDKADKAEEKEND